MINFESQLFITVNIPIFKEYTTTLLPVDVYRHVLKIIQHKLAIKPQDSSIVIKKLWDD